MYKILKRIKVAPNVEWQLLKERNKISRARYSNRSNRKRI